MKYIIYLTTNLKSKINGNNRVYMGVHKTLDPDVFDGYIGCGVYLNKPSSFKYPKSPLAYAAKKYGAEAFKRTTLYVFDTAEEAYEQASKLITDAFIKLPYTYNIEIEENGPLYQFDLKGRLLKKWNHITSASEFYGYMPQRFMGLKKTKCQFLDSYWADTDRIRISDFSLSFARNQIYLFSIEGKLIKVFDSQQECADSLSIEVKDVAQAIKNQRLVNNQYYISNKMVDEFKPKPRRQWLHATFHVYKESGEYLGEYKGKAVMKVINLHSWTKINNIFTKNHNRYLDFYVSTEKVDVIPPRPPKKDISIEIYTKYGKYIETLKSFKEVRDKYNVPASKLKGIQLGDKYFGDYIFKYVNK